MRIHKEGYKIIFNSFLIIAAITALFVIFCGSLLCKIVSISVASLLFAFVVRFFRDPQRVPESDPEYITSPADGTIVSVKKVYENEYLKTECIQVSVFMSVFNVHVNWYPCNGTVEYYKYHPGKYLVAMHPKSSEKNERTTLVLNTNGTKVLIRQIAGLLARRIVCYAKENQEVEHGSQIGFIKFGSRVDLFLPLDARIQVTKGQKVKGNITTLARLSPHQ